MDDAACRVNPKPLQALLRIRALREENALRAVQQSIRAIRLAEAREVEATETLVRHNQRRRDRETGLIAQMVSEMQTAGRIMSARYELEALAEKAVDLAQDKEAARQAIIDAEAALVRQRAVHLQRARETQKWRKTTERVETAQAAFRAAEEEGTQDEERADRIASAVLRRC